ncbi:hypothetical protein CFP56_021425, partial [Quercus suber]
GVLLKFLVHLSYGQLSNIGSSCCKAISEIEVNYLSNFFPFNPIFAPLLSNSCALELGTYTFTSGSRSDHCEQPLFASEITFPRTIRRELGKKRCKMLVITFKHLIENNVS